VGTEIEKAAKIAAPKAVEKTQCGKVQRTDFLTLLGKRCAFITFPQLRRLLFI
jgi:hypothetical protein